MAETAQLKDDAADLAPLDLAVAEDVVSDFRVNGEQAVEIAAGIRAASALPINRRNVANRITLEITKAPAASPAEAKQDAAAQIAALKEKLATATLLELVFGAVTLRLSDAAISSYVIHARGTSVYATYNIVGGDLSEVVS